ncbi:META domain-containing protein [Hymenobacter terrestris]|uniref:META domain-containing protein n=1 Tax=Hymenobacter terrestris TaxID=2748310 RepID=A0ABX2Q6V5_9BACT|nr:META domain-containing protein [Hymenobacter terrestris]
MRPRLLLPGILLLLGSCQKEARPAEQLRQTRWMLSQVDDFPITLSSYADAYRTYVQFSAYNTTAGLSPCNSFTGTYSFGASTGELSISNQTATQTSCPVQTLETLYLDALPRTVRYELSGKELRLYETGSMKPHLVFTATP